jgi:hypothetical protein
MKDNILPFSLILHQKSIRDLKDDHRAGKLYTHMYSLKIYEGQEKQEKKSANNTLRFIRTAPAQSDCPQGNFLKIFLPY